MRTMWLFPDCFFSPPGSKRAVSSRRRGAVCVPGGVRAHRHARARGRAPQHGVGGPDPHLPAGGGGGGAGLRPAGPGWVWEPFKVKQEVKHGGQFVTVKNEQQYLGLFSLA